MDSPNPPESVSIAKNEMVESALEYLYLGLAPVPLCVGKKKLSLRTGELERYRNDPPSLNQIRSWWVPKSKRNIGILCGSSSNGLLVRDF